MKKVYWRIGDEWDYELEEIYFDLPESFGCDYITHRGITDEDLYGSAEENAIDRGVREAIASGGEYGTWEDCDENDWDRIAVCADYWFGDDPKEETLFEDEGIRVYVKHGILREEDDAYTYACEDTPENRQAYIADAKETVKEWAR